MVIVLLLYLMGAKEAVCVNILRILLSGFLFGNLFSILYSLAGATVSFFVMWLTKKRHLSIRPVSVLGGISHNIGQFSGGTCAPWNSHVVLSAVSAAHGYGNRAL